MKKCLVAPDSFKGTLSATEVCHEVEDAFAAAMPCCSVVSIPIADGGEGTLDCLARALPESPIEIHKAWREQVHRMLAGVLGGLVFALALVAASIFLS